MFFHRLSLIPALLAGAALCAQHSQVGGNSARIEILNTDRLEFDRTISGAQRLVGNVRLKHENAIMRCDSAHLFDDQTLQAFGNVGIDQGDTLHITGDRLDYSGRDRMATITGHVHLNDPGMELTTDLLTYGLRERVARYSTGATIISHREQNTLTSRNGAYLAARHRFIFSDNVHLEHPERTIDADTLHYTTTTGVAEFFGPTRIVQDSTRMFCERGSYDTRAERGRFIRGARIVDGAQELRGDSVHYDKHSGLGEAWGHVQVIDTASDMLVRGDVGEHREKDERSMITGHAELVMLMDADSLFLHADTLFANNDSSHGRTIMARRGVRFFKKDMQGICDTMTYAERDSVITLIGAPYLWNGKDQISGRTITITLHGGKAHRMYVRREALLANSVDSTITDEQDAFFNQVTGTNITGYFHEGELTHIVADGTTRSVYFAREEDREGVEKTTGMNRVDCSLIDVALDSGEVSTVTFITKPDATLYPIDTAPREEMRMKGFVWNEAMRPRDRAGIFLEP